MSEEQTSDQTGEGQEQSGRPGGAPERTLAAERIEALEQQIKQLGDQITQSSAQAAEHKGAKRTMEQQVEELIASQQATQRELHLAKIETAAAKVGAKDPDLVAALVAGQDNFLAAIDGLKQSKPYLFGAAPRPAGADMGSGTGGQGSGLDDLDKHLADKYGARG